MHHKTVTQLFSNTKCVLSTSEWIHFLTFVSDLGRNDRLSHIITLQHQIITAFFLNYCLNMTHKTLKGRKLSHSQFKNTLSAAVVYLSAVTDWGEINLTDDMCECLSTLVKKCLIVLNVQLVVQKSIHLKKVLADNILMK